MPAVVADGCTERSTPSKTGLICYHYKSAAGWSSLVARRAHNPKVAGSNPAPAIEKARNAGLFLVPNLVAHST